MALLSRRDALLGALVAPTTDACLSADAALARLAALEKTNGGRLGVAALDGTGAHLGHRADERFPMCSTFKATAVALVLARADRGRENLDRRIVFAAGDLMAWSPVTRDRVGPPGMRMAELCEAAITMSDNTAANLIVASFGGPAGLTAWLRTLDDGMTRLDRVEPALNDAVPGDPRDTTTPAAMLADLRKVALGDVLSGEARARLVGWMAAGKLSERRLRAGLPKSWRVADKSGTGRNGATNDIAVAWPPAGRPVVMCAYYVGSQISSDAREAVLAEVGRIVAAFARR